MKNFTILIFVLSFFSFDVNAQIFGNTLQNYDNSSFSRNYITYWKIITGSGDSGSFTHLGINSLPTNTSDGKLALYSHNSSTNRPGNLLGEVATFTPITGLNVLPLLATVTLQPNASYYIAFKCNISNFRCGSYDNNGSNQWPNGVMPYASHNWGDPWPATAPFTSQYQEKHFTIFAIGNNAPLSVDLIEFTGILNQEGVELEWYTAAELNNAQFEVQHSLDARQWTTIGNKTGNGNTLVEKAYAFLHPDPVNGDNFYRLKQIDYDGAFSFSDIITIRNNHSSEIQIFPNPTQGDLFLKGLVPSQNTSIRIINNLGKVVISSPINEAKLDLKKLENGIYQLIITQGASTTHKTFVKE